MAERSPRRLRPVAGGPVISSFRLEKFWPALTLFGVCNDPALEAEMLRASALDLVVDLGATIAMWAADRLVQIDLMRQEYLADAEAVVFALHDGERLRVAVAAPADLVIARGHNLGGEPRDTVAVDLPDAAFVTVDAAAELDRRGAWARCVQGLGALDAAVEYSVAHTREREQFGRPLSAFQAVQHTLASMAGEVERARAAAELAVAAAAEYGFGSTQTDYAVTVAKVVLGRAVPTVVTAAHQLHGAIGVTIEHRLWLATMRARGWVDEFGDTATHARKLGRLALAAARDGDPWDVVVGGR